MELVYLWVEEYKNIRNQGFNFSPSFECEFKDGVLTICDKKKKECKNNEYLENFFGKNINVTAIVGENGTGKSNVFEIIITLLTSINKNENSDNTDDSNNSEIWLTNEQKEKIKEYQEMLKKEQNSNNDSFNKIYEWDGNYSVYENIYDNSLLENKVEKDW